MSSRSAIKIISYCIIAVLFIAGIKSADIYNKAYRANTQTPRGKDTVIYIHTGSCYEDVLKILHDEGLLRNEQSFAWTAEKKNYPSHVHAGRYLVKDNMTNNALVNMLRSGLQEPVNVVINHIRTCRELTDVVAKQIEADADSLFALLNNDAYISDLGFDRYSILGMFIPNTYEFWWNTSAPRFLERMASEYERFWTKKRQDAAKEIGLNRNQAITLASIVMAETNKADEYRRIAGVYMNRISRGIKLQADPTIKYAIGDPQRQRILKKDMEVVSPYNTYMYYGLPPGPISSADIDAIDAVLDYERHGYIYFCAKDDFSGYHVFATTLDQHNKNARSYQKALNQRNILH